jgi:CheY-like chemotaxis protein
LRTALPSEITLKVECADALPLVQADATQLLQLVINLGTNAMQAMEVVHVSAGCISIRLDVAQLDAAMAQRQPALRDMYAKNTGAVLRLTVSDDGPGMDAATLERIFEPFFTTKPVGMGTGLGLSVVHGIVQTHEGAILVESERGKGATFMVYLPTIEDVAVAVVATSDESSASVVPLVASGGQHILYVDDDESLILLIQRLLERRGYRVSGYTNQDEALAALRVTPEAFDLVVSDFKMPGMSGLDVARAVRTIRADLPVVIASGFIDESLQMQAAGAGVRELIFKANAVEDLSEAFARVARAFCRKA